jgi:hypothetical protein
MVAAADNQDGQDTLGVNRLQTGPTFDVSSGDGACGAKTRETIMPKGDCSTKLGDGYKLRFTPAEWRSLLHDESFLRDPDNDFHPRRLMGLPVEIVPDHGGRRLCTGR